jgi:hypothetical protein
MTGKQKMITHMGRSPRQNVLLQLDQRQYTSYKIKTLSGKQPIGQDEHEEYVCIMSTEMQSQNEGLQKPHKQVKRAKSSSIGLLL